MCVQYIYIWRVRVRTFPSQIHLMHLINQAASPSQRQPVRHMTPSRPGNPPCINLHTYSRHTTTTDGRPVGRTVRTSNRRKWTIPSGNRGTFVSAYYPVHIRTQLHTFPRTGSPETRSRRPVFRLNTPFICTRPPLNMSHFAGACARYPNRARNNYSHITYIPYYNINGAHLWLTSAVAVELHVYVVVRR